MDPITAFAGLTAAVSAFKAVLINFLKEWYINEKIKDEGKRSSLLALIALLLGMLLGVIINILGGFGLSIISSICIGGGISYTGSNITNKLINIKKGKK
jgi:Kef-type K+ transport system membrane component KefB